MNKTNWLAAIGLGLLGFFLGGMACGVLKTTPTYVPPLQVVGDVNHSLRLENPDQLGKREQINYDGKKYQVLRLMDIIEEAQPVALPGQLYLVSSDGFTSSFPAQGLEKCYITFTPENGWEALNLNHPINSNAKMLQEIVVVADGSVPDFGLAVMNQDTDLVRVTPGQLYSRPLMEYPYKEGKAAVENQGKTYETSVYTKRRVFRLSDLTSVQEGDMMLVLGEKGQHRLVENRGYFELKENYINCLQMDTRSQVEKVKGVIITPPAASIMDVYYDTRHWLENGERVLILVVDGLNYRQYTRAVGNGQVPFLQKMGPVTQATGVYPLATNVWLAAMLTGVAPEENGVITEKDRDLKVPTLFALANKLQKKSLLLQAEPAALNTEIEPIIGRAENGCQTAEAELYALALDKLDQDYDLIMVRWPGIIDREKGLVRLVESGPP